VYPKLTLGSYVLEMYILRQKFIDLRSHLGLQLDVLAFQFVLKDFVRKQRMVYQRKEY